MSLVFLMMLKINCIIAQIPFTCVASIKKKNNGALKLKLVLKSLDNKKFISTSNRFNSLYNSFSYSNCGFDTVDFTFNSDGIRRSTTIDKANIAAGIHYEDHNLALAYRKGKRVKYIFAYNPICNKTIYYVVRYASVNNEFYKCVIELKYNITEKPKVKIIKIENIRW